MGSCREPSLRFRLWLVPRDLHVRYPSNLSAIQPCGKLGSVNTEPRHERLLTAQCKWQNAGNDHREAMCIVQATSLATSICLVAALRMRGLPIMWSRSGRRAEQPGLCAGNSWYLLDRCCRENLRNVCSGCRLTLEEPMSVKCTK